MRIGMVLANHPYPPDIRVDKEAGVLAAGGGEVLLLCRGDAAQPAEETVGDIHVVRHRVHPRNTLLRKLDSLLYMLTLDSPSWRRGMRDLVRVHGAQALHLHDLPYARSVIRAARAEGVPVVLDFHENYPAAIALWGRRARARLSLSSARAARLERWAIKHADRIVVVVDEAKARIVGLGADPERVVVFGNTESVDLVPAEPLPLGAGDGLRLVYVGGVAAHRGLDTAVDAMPAILERDPKARLTIVGDGATLGELKAQVARLGLGDAVRFTGWVSKDEAMHAIEDADLALVPHHRSPHTDATIPHKLFQYMALGRPVLVSDCAPLARVVRSTGAGAVFRSGDAADLATQALALADPARSAAAAKAGRRAVVERWNLETEAPALIGLYAGLAAQRSRS